MGYDPDSFHCEVDEELICTICNWVLKEPLQTQNCEHSFCSQCILEWLKEQRNCPICRTQVDEIQLKAVPRIQRNLLGKLLVSCENHKYGCTSVVRLDQLQTHLPQCQFNPKRLVPCKDGCDMVIPLNEISTHNCIKEMCLKIDTQNKVIENLEQNIISQNTQLQNQQSEIDMLKDFFRTISSYASTLPTRSRMVSQIDQNAENVRGWINSIPVATVTMWGGMISTPDAILQEGVKQRLTQMNCAPTLMESLMENAHERKWPSGINTLETRQMNRHRYNQFMCRRIPGKQAIMIFACENQHMPDSMIAQPGFVIIFAHGVD